MRLTLRTLLAYLDDTLEPAETKRIGQKVAESDAARELIARIKQVTRRRRLTTPPATGPNAFEPNTVAEYLDNTLPPDQVAEIEKACLESDVHLAEIAAAHQILTLVLGQPALVPPTARQRMYALHGRKTRVRAAAAAATTTTNGAANPDADSRSEEDETLLLGLPLYRRQAAMRWLLPAAALLLLAGLAVVLGLALYDTDHGKPLAVVNDTSRTPQPPPDSHKDEQPHDDGNKPPEQPGPGKPSGGPDKPGDGEKPPVKPPVKPIVRPDPPSDERREVGRYPRDVLSVLVSRPVKGGTDGWQRLRAAQGKDRISTGDLLVSLPGYKSDLRLDSGVNLTLWGSLYEFFSPFLESAVVLHAPAKGLDADFTLDRGAVLIASQKDQKEPKTVRVRFLGEVWDVTLEDPDTEVGITLLGRHVLPYGSGEPPRADGFLLVRKGRATVSIRPYVEYSNLEPKQEGRRSVPLVIFWDSVGKGTQPPVPVPQDPRLQNLLGVFDDPLRSELLEPADRDRIKEMQAALDGMDRRLGGPGKIESLLIEMLQPAETAPAGGLVKGALAVRSLGALDAVTDLVNVLDDADKPRALRGEAISTLRHWIGRNAAQEGRLVDPKTRSGVLTEGGKFNLSDARTFVELLHTPVPQQRRSPAYWAFLIDNLKSDRLALRELAFFHLRRWVPESAKIDYDPTGTPEARLAAYKKWKDLIPDDKLPPTRPPE